MEAGRRETVFVSSFRAHRIDRHAPCSRRSMTSNRSLGPLYRSRRSHVTRIVRTRPVRGLSRRHQQMTFEKAGGIDDD